MGILGANLRVELIVRGFERGVPARWHWWERAIIWGVERLFEIREWPTNRRRMRRLEAMLKRTEKATAELVRIRRELELDGDRNGNES